MEKSLGGILKKTKHGISVTIKTHPPGERVQSPHRTIHPPKLTCHPRQGQDLSEKIHLNQHIDFYWDEFVRFQGRKCTRSLEGPLKTPPVKVEFIKQDAKVAEVWASCWVEHFAKWARVGG